MNYVIWFMYGIVMTLIIESLMLMAATASMRNELEEVSNDGRSDFCG